ncbi:MAG TPA: nuclear transport factor 2 family protein [Tepidisphaeraceae bacterium]|jgi:hypothetical protein
MHRRSFLSGVGAGLGSAALVGAGIAVRSARPVRPGAADPRPSVPPTSVPNSSADAATNINVDDGLPGIATIAGPVEHRVTSLPPGPLYWQIETFPTFAEASTAATPYSMTLDAEGRGWLFTLGHQGDQTPGATHLAEIGPLPVPDAPEYLLQLSYQSRAGKVVGTEHSHPGVESWYMFAGQQTVQFPTLEQEVSASAGQGLMGPPANTPLRIINTSAEERRAFNLFVLDYTAPAQATGDSVATVDATFKQTFQAGDLDATMALFAPETVEISPFGVFPGKDAIRKSVETFIKANPGFQVSFSDSQIVENTAVHHVTLTSDAIKNAGVASVSLIHTLVVSRGKIVMLAQQLDLADPETARYSIGLAPQGR